ncbi:T9SS type B sorting domain-containing protein [Flavobacterium cerinum]|uniref:Gliding motility-associated C-terminal domain-containing protein n=1 Tax=Flavobacterium cerinum TaxID=2502784 RepID=A0A3S3SG31_9FLAO|nr:gliding motility-associated C-terminal domain-containing protein [Flavobacterium cerinum]RWX02258.1 gliding motility-associated C-terminal domain-containing protein [Flavobacterium cerinum]
MHKELSYQKALLLIITLFFSLCTFAQLPAFTFNLTSTPETCSGNGTLNFTVSGTVPGAAVGYEIYLLPNTTTPVNQTSASSLVGLEAGNYMVRATQNLAGQTSTNTQNATIANQVAPLTFGIAFTKVRCGNDGTITATVQTGSAVSYEIIAGPVTKPLQPLPLFSGLPAGLYQVRAYNACGDATVVSVQVDQATTSVIIQPVGFPGSALPSCNTINVQHQYLTTTGNIIFFPLTFQYTVFPPGGGAPIVVTTVVNSGVLVNDIITAIPFYHNQLYSYNLKITDACGNVYNRNNNEVDQKLTISADSSESGCNEHLFVVKPKNYMPPYTLEFTSFPAGFVPGNLNPNHPVFSTDDVIYGGNGNSAPLGNYTVKITDACSRIATAAFEVKEIPVEPIQSSQATGCTASDGSISIIIPGRTITNVVMTTAPVAYPNPLPDVVGSNISVDNFVLSGLPLGTYTFIVTDVCGDVYTVVIEIVFSPPVASLTILQRQGCELGFGSVRVSGGEPLTNIKITAAPAGFTQPLPYNGASNLSQGVFYMNSLPAGSYTFESISACGIPIAKQVTVAGSITLTNEISLAPNCGMFGVNLNFVSNANYIQTFWLQKFNPAEGTWEHPTTGVNYPEGGAATNNNSYSLINGTLNNNINSIGHFRVVKTFFIYDNGSNANARCVQTLYEFDFDGGPAIIDAYSFPCANSVSDVVIVAIGAAPLIYKIIEKNGAPFLVNNNQSNVFTGLEIGTYKFEITDKCGEKRTRILDISELNPIAIKADGFCEGENSTLSVPEFSFLTYKWWKQGAPGTILSTTGTLPFPAYNSNVSAGTYICSIVSGNPDSCMNQVLEFTLDNNIVPNAGADNNVIYCNTGMPLDLKTFLAATAEDGGSWQDVNATGALTGSTLTTLGLGAGIYQFKYIVTGLCNAIDEAIITLDVKDIPALPVITGTTPVCEGGNVQLTAVAVPGAVYEWTGPNGFTSALQNPLIPNATVQATGTYSLKIKNNICVSPVANVDVIVNAAARAGEDDTVVVCNDGNAVDLTDFLNGSNNNNGVWEDVSATGALTGSTFNPSAVAAGSYQFKYTVTNVCNTTDEAIITIQLNDIPLAPAIDAIAPVCEGSNVQFNTTAVTDAVYKWSGPNGFISAEQNPLLTGAGLAANGTYSLIVEVNGCASPVAVIPVTIKAAPQFTIEGNTLLCDGQTSSLTVVPGNFTGNAAYKWYYNEGLLEDITAASIEIQETGTYKVIVENNDCTTTREIVVAPNDNPFEIIIDSGCVNYDYMLWVANLSDIQGAVVTWTGPAGFNFTGTEANITNLPSGNYTATITNDEGCTAIATLPIDNTSCIIPRGISPNGDGMNDYFDLSNLDVIEIKIFNRYGLEVYESKNYKKEWYGQSSKGTLPTGTYYYVITLSAGKKVTGWVYLQREIK